jgi:DNA-binding NarL/FixJ family response regulator
MNQPSQDTSHPHLATNPGARKTVLIVDDSPIVRAGIAAVLGTYPRLLIVAEAGDADTALSNATVLKPDVVLLDWRLPGAEGDGLCRKLRALLPDSGLLVLSSAGDPATLRAALDAGADGYLLKETDARTLAEAIISVSEGRAIFDKNLTETLASVYRSEAPRSGHQALKLLSQQEREILRLVAEGLTNKEIGARLTLAEKTVKNNLTRVFETLGVRTRVQAATWWLQHVSS